MSRIFGYLVLIAILQVKSSHQNRTTNSCMLNLPPRMQAHYVNQSNIRISQNTNVENHASVVYTCKENSILSSGSNINVCSNGKWNFTVPNCTIICLTKNLNNPSISVTCAYLGKTVLCVRPRPGTLAQINCANGYIKPVGHVNDILRCGDDGEWDFQPYHCEPICGIVPPESSNIKMPWQAGIYSNINTVTTTTYAYTCSGTIIATKLVISTSDCFVDNESSQLYASDRYMIAVGKYYRDYDANEPQKIQKIQVAAIHRANINAEYSSSKADSSSPAVLVLANEIVLSLYVTVVCMEYRLGIRHMLVPNNSMGRVAGWNSSVLQVHDDIPSIGLQRCRRLTRLREIANDKFCASLESNLTLNNGFSGAGMVFSKIMNDVKVYFLRGVVDWSTELFSDRMDNQYMILTNIQFYSNFINEIRQQNLPTTVANTCIQLNESRITITCEYQGKTVACDQPKVATLAKIQFPIEHEYMREHVTDVIECGTDGEWKSTENYCINASENCSTKLFNKGANIDNNNLANRTSSPVTKTSVASGKSCSLALHPDMLAYYGHWPNLPLYGDEDVPHGAVIKYECQGNYNTPGGSATNTCNDGSWVNAHPSCEPFCLIHELTDRSVEVSCEILNQNISCAQPRPGTLAKIKCAEGYYKPLRHVHEIIQCGDNGKWDLNPYRCDIKCGVVADGLPNVINGVSINITKIPWQAAIYSDLNRNRIFSHICGGSILTTRVVISAAHCFYDEKDLRLNSAEHFMVGLGKAYSDYSAVEPLKVQIIPVASIKHPKEFAGHSSNYEGDAALVFLTDDIVIMNHVNPICMDYGLRLGQRLVPSDWNGLVAGWGTTSNNGISSKGLQALENIPSIDYQKCKRLVNSAFLRYMTTDKFCAGYEGNIMVSQGDSGGGISFPQQIGEEKVYFLRGLVSMGPNFLRGVHTHHYTIFTNVQYYSRMIQRETSVKPLPLGMKCHVLVTRHLKVFKTGRSNAQIANGTEVKCNTLVKYECEANSTLGEQKRTNFCLNGNWLYEIPSCQIF